MQTRGGHPKVYTLCTCLCWLALLHMFADNTVSAIDCKKYVFAPQCRGAGAKRSFMPDSYTDDRIPTPNDEIYPVFVRNARVHPFMYIPQQGWQQASKPDTAYDTYAGYKKRPRDTDTAYDY